MSDLCLQLVSSDTEQHSIHLQVCFCPIAFELWFPLHPQRGIFSSLAAKCSTVVVANSAYVPCSTGQVVYGGFLELFVEYIWECIETLKLPSLKQILISLNFILSNQI